MAVLVGCAVCFGSMHSGVKLVMLGLLLLPFTLVGSMMGFLYVKGAFATRSPEAGEDRRSGSATPTPAGRN